MNGIRDRFCVRVRFEGAQMVVIGVLLWAYVEGKHLGALKSLAKETTQLHQQESSPPPLPSLVVLLIYFSLHLLLIHNLERVLQPPRCLFGADSSEFCFIEVVKPDVP